ncbi:MAG: NADP-dependent isocitrate dehydrogenase [Chitinophagaceae bacterium]
MLKIAVAKGDGIGPEIMDAVLRIFSAVQVPLEYEYVEMGKDVFLAGHSTGMTDAAKQSIERLGILFKGPMETPKGKGMKSINVTARKVWNTYANNRVFRSLHGVDTVFSKAGIPINITIVRENIEDTYGGIEHKLTDDVAVCRRFITRPGSAQVHRYAFEMARKRGIKKVTCGHKANIMKITDGLFLETFYEVAKEYPEIQTNDVIVDDLAMKLVIRPGDFEMVVLPNLMGDIMSDLCAGLVGGLGFAPSANIGDNISIFEAVHGTAPDIAGKNIANPTALLLSGIMMLQHLGLTEEAAQIQNALLYTLEQGVHTGDFGDKAIPSVNTTEFADAIIANLGKLPVHQPVTAVPSRLHHEAPKPLTENKIWHTEPKPELGLNGVDFFFESTDQPQAIGARINAWMPAGFKLSTLSNRGTQVYPKGSVYTECINQYRGRIEKTDDRALQQADIWDLTRSFSDLYRICSTECLITLDGKEAYSLAQGQ